MAFSIFDLRFSICKSSIVNRKSAMVPEFIGPGKKERKNTRLDLALDGFYVTF